MLSVVMISVIKVNAASAFEQVSIMVPSARKKLLIMHPTSCSEPGAVFTKLFLTVIYGSNELECSFLVSLSSLVLSLQARPEPVRGNYLHSKLGSWGRIHKASFSS
jgi:hypothetical protein